MNLFHHDAGAAPQRGLRAVLALAALSALAGGLGCIQIVAFEEPKIQTVVVEPSPVWLEVNRVAVIDVSGFLTTADAGPLFRPYSTTVAEVRERLKLAAEDWRVKAVVLRIHSPGGEVTASDILRAQIAVFREETGKPVVACLMGVAASGGYYVATGADRIVASPTTVTGSVGVIMEYYNVQDLFEKVGVQKVTFKSGEKKDMGTAARAPTDAERADFERLTARLFDRFVMAVRTGRPMMGEAEIAAIKDGRIMAADEALALKMVDRVGHLEDAVEEAIRLAGVRSAEVVMYRMGRSPHANLYASTAAHTQSPGELAFLVQEGVKALMERRGAAFLYLWKP